MKLIVATFAAMVMAPLAANALWCQCITNPGDPFNDWDQTRSVCSQMGTSAVYMASDLLGLRQARCDVGPSGSAKFKELCGHFGASTVPNCY